MLKKILIATGLIAAAATSAYAATQNVTANIAFDSALTIVKNADIDFGVVIEGVADTYTIDTAAVVTAAGPGEIIGGTPVAGDLTISGSATQVIDISVANYVADNGVTPQNAICSYDGGAEADCNTLTGVAAPGAGKTLLLGVEADVDGTQVAGDTAAPTFDVVVNYQ